MTELNASDFAGPNEMMKAIEGATWRDLNLPVRLRVGKRSFTITWQDMHGFRLGVLMATDEAWEQNKERKEG